jgi:hypothetical protein
VVIQVRLGTYPVSKLLANSGFAKRPVARVGRRIALAIENDRYR